MKRTTIRCSDAPPCPASLATVAVDHAVIDEPIRLPDRNDVAALLGSEVLIAGRSVVTHEIVGCLGVITGIGQNMHQFMRKSHRQITNRCGDPHRVRHLRTSLGVGAPDCLSIEGRTLQSIVDEEYGRLPQSRPTREFARVWR